MSSTHLDPERKLSLVVPTYQRQEFALRQMANWSGTKVTLHIFDGTPRPIPSDLLCHFASNVHYHHLPESFGARLLTAARRVDTPYVAILGDDDIFLPSGLNACTQELDRHPELVSCMGRCLAFQIQKDGIIGKLHYPEMKDRLLAQNDPMERVSRHMKPYSPSTIYGVTRTEVWKNSIQTAFLNEVSCVYLCELAFEVATSFQGKSKVLPNLMWLRSYENTPVNHGQWSRKLQLVDWLTSSQYRDEVQTFLQTATRKFTEMGNVDSITAQTILEKALKLYRGYCHKKAARSKSRIRKFIKRVEARLFRPSDTWQPLESLKITLTAEGIQFDRAEFENTTHAVMAFHSSRSKPSSEAVQ